MQSFTLDSNCIIAIEENRAEAAAIRRLAAAHAANKADVAVVAIMASEKQKPGVAIENFLQFKGRLERLQLGHLPHCLPMAYTNISYVGACVLGGGRASALEVKIQKILFPSIECDFSAFCATRNLTAPVPYKQYNHWRNAKCDVQALWSNVIRARDVFVTSDRNFHKSTKHPALIALGAGAIERPDAAAALL